MQDNEDAENGDDVVINEQVSGDFQDSLDVESETENVEENQPDVEEKHEERSSSTRGPKPIYERFPTLVSTIVAFIQNHGFVAQERRRDETYGTVGVSMSDIKAHVYETIPGLKAWGVSNSTLFFIVPSAFQAQQQRCCL